MKKRASASREEWTHMLFSCFSVEEVLIPVTLFFDQISQYRSDCSDGLIDQDSASLR